MEEDETKNLIMREEEETDPRVAWGAGITARSG